MWLVLMVGAILFLIGFVMWLFGADETTILLTLVVIGLVCSYLFLGACIYLVTLLFTPSGSAWPFLTPILFFVLVALVHWRSLKR
jgi:hypothetical protein